MSVIINKEIAIGYHNKKINTFFKVQNQIVLGKLNKIIKVALAILFMQLFEVLEQLNNLQKKRLLNCWNKDNKNRFFILISGHKK